MLPESDYRFERELAEWFSRRAGAWSGTASELLASLRTKVSQTIASVPTLPMDFTRTCNPIGKFCSLWA